MATKTKGPKPQPNKASLVEEILAARRPTVPGPSGFKYRVYPINFQRQALETGNLPDLLQRMAFEGEEFEEEMKADAELQVEYRAEVKAWHEQLVRKVIIEPDLTDVDLDVLPPEDYDWALEIALGEEVNDGNGDKIVGAWRADLEKHATFRDGSAGAQGREARSERGQVPAGQ
jgi:hypothetical protein